MLTPLILKLPAHWASYLINIDSSGLEQSEIDKIDSFLEKENLPTPCACEETSYFTYSNDADNIGCEVLNYTFLIEENETSKNLDGYN